MVSGVRVCRNMKKENQSKNRLFIFLAVGYEPTKKPNSKPSGAGLSWKGRAMKLRRKNSRSYETAVLEQSGISSDVVESGGLTTRCARMHKFDLAARTTLCLSLRKLTYSPTVLVRLPMQKNQHP